MPGGPGPVGVVVALVDATVYDGLSGTTWWQRTLALASWWTTPGWSAQMMLVAVAFLLGTWSLVTPRFSTSGVGTLTVGPPPAPSPILWGADRSSTDIVPFSPAVITVKFQPDEDRNIAVTAPVSSPSAGPVESSL